MAYLYLKLKPYLKEFILNMEAADGTKLYGPEPVKFPPKDRLGLLVEHSRRKPYSSDKNLKPPAGEIDSYLKVEFTPNPTIPNDDIRTAISDEKMSHIAKYIYNIFCATAFDYVVQHLYWQSETLPNSRPMKSMAYRAFIEDFGLMSAEEDSIRKAVDRDPRQLPFSNIEKNMKNKWRFKPKNHQLRA